MYSSQTRKGVPVQVGDDLSGSLATGRILVVDDDKAFGCFVMAALESRGHQVEWAACLQDGLTALYANRYDLAIIDLRLPDGSGIEFLRDAIDEGLFADSAAIILTGHDFEQPDDIRVFHKPLDLDPFLDRMADIVAQTKRRRGTLRRPPAPHRGTASDDGRPSKDHRIELVLYTSPASEKCQKALRTVRAVLEQYDASQIRFTICDLSRDPHSEDDAVVFTPTLVKRGPGPRTWIVGNLDQPELLVDLLDVSGVERRRD